MGISLYEQIKDCNMFVNSKGIKQVLIINYILRNDGNEKIEMKILPADSLSVLISSKISDNTLHFGLSSISDKNSKTNIK